MSEKSSTEWAKTLQELTAINRHVLPVDQQRKLQQIIAGAMERLAIALFKEAESPGGYGKHAEWYEQLTERTAK